MSICFWVGQYGYEQTVVSVIKTWLFCGDLFTEKKLNLTDSKVRKLKSFFSGIALIPPFNRLDSTGAVFVNMFLSEKYWPAKVCTKVTLSSNFLDHRFAVMLLAESFSDRIWSLFNIKIRSFQSTSWTSIKLDDICKESPSQAIYMPWSFRNREILYGQVGHLHFPESRTSIFMLNVFDETWPLNAVLFTMKHHPMLPLLSFRQSEVVNFEMQVLTKRANWLLRPNDSSVIGRRSWGSQRCQCCSHGCSQPQQQRTGSLTRHTLATADRGKNESYGSYDMTLWCLGRLAFITKQKNNSWSYSVWNSWKLMKPIDLELTVNFWMDQSDRTARNGRISKSTVRSIYNIHKSCEGC